MTYVFILVLLSVHIAHNVPDLKPNAAHLNQIPLFQFVAWDLHLRLKSLFNHLPYLLLGLVL